MFYRNSASIATVPRFVDPKVTNDEHVRLDEDGRPFKSNKISTTRYSLWNFFPVTIMLQFTKIANCFYLMNGVL